MNRSHVTSGLAVGLAVGRLTGLVTVLTVAPFAIVVAGFALFPDLDCGGSSASRLLGPVTGLMSRGLRAASSRLYRHTRGPRDKPGSGEHRHLTHTWPFCVVFTALIEGVVLKGGMWAALAVVLFGVLAAVDRLGNWVFIPTGLAALGWYATAKTTHTPLAVAVVHDTRWVALAAGLGCVVHILGDAPTLSGVPLTFPFVYKGQRWYPVRVPRRMRFRVGDTAETRWIFPALVTVTVLLVPGVWPHLVGLVAHGGSAWRVASG